MRAAGEAARRKKLPTTLSQHEILLGMHLKELGYGDYQREFRFFPERKWRFDYAVPRRKLAIEIEGGIWGTVDRFGDASSERGRHLRAAGYQDEGIAAVEKLMTDRLIGDVATAAKVYKIEAAETAEAAAPPRMGPAPIEWPQNRFKGLTENPNQWARTEAYAALQDIQQGKVSA